MKKRDVRAYLRGATGQKLIWSWKQVGVDELVVNPWPAPMEHKTTDEAVEYCLGLEAAGIKPFYVTTELLPSKKAA